MLIIVNGETKLVDSVETMISYESVAEFAGYDSKRVLTMTYHTRRKGDEQRQGIMHPGCDPVRIEEGMVFNVADTSNA